MTFTCQSEYHPLHSVVLNRATQAFLSEEKLKSEWQSLGYKALPDFKKAKEEYGSFEAILRNRGIKCEYLPPSQMVSSDAIYCRDAAIATDHGMILCNMGKEARKAEPALHEACYNAKKIPVLGRIEPPGTLEGGDVAWIDTATLAVGRSYRTNTSGIRQLKNILDPLGVAVIAADLPHFRGPSDVFHLMSVFSPLASNLAVVYSPLLPISFREELLYRGYRFVEVPEEEFESMGCNVLSLSPEACLMVSGNPRTQSSLAALGIEVITYNGNEISIKGGGGPTCLTRPLKRCLHDHILR
jgi:N-dimethylarginine dimethylaminohydrolase